MELQFIKMQLGSRDTILVDARRNPGVDAALLGAVGPGALDRRLGIGADTILLVSKTPDGDLQVRSFSAPGREEEPSLNELMCAGRYAVDSGLAGGTAAQIQGTLRSVAVDALDSRSILADIGEPRRDSGEELVERPEVAYTRTVRIDERDFTYTPVRVGAYQAVSFVPTFTLDVRRLARGFRRATSVEETDPPPPIADPAQLTFTRVISRRRLLTRTWRYGHGEVRSEGYAAAAAGVTAALHGFADRDTIVATRGGDLYVLWSEANNRLYVTGAPEYVFTGTYSAEERRDGGQAV